MCVCPAKVISSIEERPRCTLHRADRRYRYICICSTIVHSKRQRRKRQKTDKTSYSIEEPGEQVSPTPWPFTVLHTEQSFGAMLEQQPAGSFSVMTTGSARHYSSLSSTYIHSVHSYIELPGSTMLCSLSRILALCTQEAPNGLEKANQREEQLEL